MIRVKLHGKLNSLLPPNARQKGLSLEIANGLEFFSGIEHHAPGFRELLSSTPSHIYVGRSLKSARKVSTTLLSGPAIANLNKGEKQITIHIVPVTSGSAEALAGALDIGIIPAVISYGVGKLFEAIFGKDGDRNDTKKRTNSTFEGGMNTRDEGVALPITLGRRVRVGMNFVETDVSINDGSRSDTTFTPGFGATQLGYGGDGTIWGEGFRHTGTVGFQDQSQGLSGSKTGGGASGGKTMENNIQSDATVMGLGIYSSGPTGGIYGSSQAEKEQNIFIGNVRLRGLNGQASHNGFIWDERLGYEDQTATSITNGVPSIIDYQTRELTATNLSGEKVYLTEAVRDAKADYIKVIFGFTLVEANKEGDQKPSTITFAADTRANSSQPWVRMGSWTINKKTSEVCQRQYVVPAPLGADKITPWEFRVYRDTPDSTDDKKVNKSSFYGWTEVQKLELTYGGDEDYPACAYLTYAIDLAAFGDNTLPEVTADVHGMLVDVPSNWDQATNTYSGSWNGIYRLAWTDEPVWCWKALASMGNGAEYPDDPQDSWFDRYALYDIAKFNSQLVDGQPRFTFNKQLADAKDARTVLREVAHSFFAQVYETGDQLMLVQDRPGQPVVQYINNNHAPKGFIYRDMELADQPNVVEMSYEDRDANSTKALVKYEDEASIARLKGKAPEGGRITKRHDKMGCTNAKEAFRLAKLHCRAGQKQVVTVTFDTMRNAIGYIPGELIAIQDSNVNGQAPNSRVKASLGVNRVELDAPFEFKSGVVYALWAMRNNTFVKLAIPPFAQDTRTAILDIVGLGLVRDNMVGIVADGEAQPRVFRILGILDKEDGSYTVTGLEHDEGKWAWAEDGVVPEIIPWTNVNADAPMPTGLVIGENTSVHPVLGSNTTLTIAWDLYRGPAQVKGYMVEHLPPTGAWQTIYRGPETVASLPYVVPGLHTFTVKSISIDGRSSEPAIQTYAVTYGGTTTDLPVLENVMVT